MKETLLKGNYVLKKKIKNTKAKQSPTEEYKDRVLSSIGGSMVYIEKTDLVWDGNDVEGK